MHEYSLVDALVRRAEEEARKNGATAIHRLKVSLGALAGVDPDLFQGAYEIVREGTLCETAALEIDFHPAAWICPSCGKSFVRGEALHCDRCDQPARMAPGSDSLQLESIELEVP